MGIDKIPEKGQKIYVPTSLHLYRGKDDFQGGLATIDGVFINNNLPEGHFNKVFVSIEENNHSQYNYASLLIGQDDLKEQFGDSKAHHDPDYREEFNHDKEGWSKVW